jgi:hypothetical protein
MGVDPLLGTRAQRLFIATSQPLTIYPLRLLTLVLFQSQSVSRSALQRLEPIGLIQSIEAVAVLAIISVVFALVRNALLILSTSFPNLYQISKHVDLNQSRYKVCICSKTFPLFYLTSSRPFHVISLCSFSQSGSIFRSSQSFVLDIGVGYSSC